MRRLPRSQRPPRSLALTCLSSSRFLARTAATRPFSTTLQRNSISDEVRKRLWKDKAPGPRDPYTEQVTDTERAEQLLRDRELAEAEQYLAEQAELEDDGLEPPPSDQKYARPPRPRTRLKLTHKKTSAPVPAEITDSDYRAATEWEGLEKINGLDDWWERPGHWGAESQFVGFARSEKIMDGSVLTVLTRQAVVEVLALRAAGEERRLTSLLPNGDREALQRTLMVSIEVSEDGQASLSGDTDSIIRGLQCEGAVAVAPEAETSPSDEATVEGSAEEAAPEPPIIEAQEAEQHVSSWDARWRNISLEEPRLKFAINKRIYQLTGHLLPDAKVARTNSVATLLELLVKPPRPRKLVKEIEQRGELLELPNVTVYNRRVNKVDKEIWVGRWKIIEQELEKRGLPAFGTGKYGKFKERDWIKGRV